MANKRTQSQQMDWRDWMIPPEDDGEFVFVRPRPLPARAIIQSVNYIAGGIGAGVGSGWRIDGTGFAEFNEVVIRTTLSSGVIQTAASGARVVLDANGLRVYDATTQRGEIKNDGSGWLGSAASFAWTSAGVLTVAGSVIGAASITAEKIAAGAITAEKIAAGAITAEKIDALAVTADKIAAGAVTATKINVANLSAISADLGTITAGTITGATIRTAAGGARVVLDATGIKQYDATMQRAELLNDGSGWLGASNKFRWTSAGVVEMNGSAILPATVTDGALNLNNVPTISGLTVTNNSPSAGYVAWSAFSLTHDGTSYAITASNTNKKYTYWVKPNTTLTTSDTLPARAANMVFVLYNNAGTGIVSLFQNFVYADYIGVTNLSAISADLGTITAGTITGATVRTAASGARAQMDNAKFACFDASENELLRADGNGLRIVAPTSYADPNAIGFTSSGAVVSGLWAQNDSSLNGILVNAKSVTGKASEVDVISTAPSGKQSIALMRALRGSTALTVAAKLSASGTGDGIYLSGGHVLFEDDATWDIGQSTTFRPRHLYLSGNAVIGGTLTVGGKSVGGQHKIVTRQSEQTSPASTDWTDVTDMSITLTTVGNAVSVFYSSLGWSQSLANYGRWRILLDGSQVAIYGLNQQNYETIAFGYKSTPAAGSHTYKVQFCSQTHYSYYAKDCVGGNAMSVLQVIESGS